jgi:hypothetical protein
LLDWNGRPLASVNVSTSRFRIEQEVRKSTDGPWSQLTIRSSHAFVPDKRQRNGDLRDLAAKIYRVSLE